MAHHLFGTVLTPHGIASNNRGENAGNVTTLQKVIKDDGLFTTVSAEAIRYAIREAFTEAGKTVNRRIASDGASGGTRSLRIGSRTWTTTCWASCCRTRRP